MTDISEAMAAMKKANDKLHPVDTQWHFKIAMSQGWTPITPSAKGFVREYKYVKLGEPEQLVVTTGAHGDYWRHAGNGGYHSTLEQYLRERSEEQQF